ncbi:MAG: OmpH family outer membrane protein [Deltaproteobacteria bacterium]|nr:OmpH family outer membrane protein [Deltaproteobacteria bacterium]
MKKVFMLVLLCLFFATALYAADVKIAVVDIQKVIRESKGGEEARTSFTKEVESKRKIISAREETLKSLEDELRKASAQERAEKGR